MSVLLQEEDHERVKYCAACIEYVYSNAEGLIDRKENREIADIPVISLARKPLAHGIGFLDNVDDNW